MTKEKFGVIMEDEKFGIPYTSSYCDRCGKITGLYWFKAKLLCKDCILKLQKKKSDKRR